MLLDSRQFDMHFGDCISHMADMPGESVDMSVFSPPFPAGFFLLPVPPWIPASLSAILTIFKWADCPKTNPQAGR